MSNKKGIHIDGREAFGIVWRKSLESFVFCFGIFCIITGFALVMGIPTESSYILEAAVISVVWSVSSGAAYVSGFLEGVGFGVDIFFDKKHAVTIKSSEPI